ncbi:hypothetical protein D5F01_LYC23948 [Larimichthys crocea]|uniref:Uncharacterized protein n=1 Tax=Larimichthys crocea TaxID=215358 RepID=A0A6G0HFN6_LARCR|nr:hypothetical protein D5F01_LYC23948 [Larimichthys crocea]
MLTSKTRITGYREAYEFCVDLWDELSLALFESQGSSLVAPSRDELAQIQGSGAVIRLALLADFYRYLKEDLALNGEESSKKLCAIRSETFKILTASRPDVRPVFHEMTVISVPAAHLTGLDSSVRDSLVRPTEPVGAYEAAVVITSQSCVAATELLKELLKELSVKEPCEKPKSKRKSRRAHGSAKRRKTSVEETDENDENAGLEKCRSQSAARPYVRYGGEDCVRWSKYCFSARRKSYYTKLVKAFHVVKTVGYPTLTLNSEWGLSCYYKLAVAYTTDQPLEMAAACLPELRRAVDIIHSEHFQKLRELKPECQMLLYAVLNCHINWVDHNHKQILLMHGQPSAAPHRKEGDLRCSRCLKNQTFRSAEVKGNPRNIDVEFDFEQMKFGSSCCAAPMINVPLSTRDVNTCTFTEMKQMYTSCLKCITNSLGRKDGAVGEIITEGNNITRLGLVSKDREETLASRETQQRRCQPPLPEPGRDPSVLDDATIEATESNVEPEEDDEAMSVYLEAFELNTTRSCCLEIGAIGCYDNDDDSDEDCLERRQDIGWCSDCRDDQGSAMSTQVQFNVTRGDDEAVHRDVLEDETAEKPKVIIDDD